MSEWFYLKSWKEARQNVWTLIDSNHNLHLPADMFLTKIEVTELQSKIREKNYNSGLIYRIVHKDSIDYENFLTQLQKRKNENNTIK